MISRLEKKYIINHHSIFEFKKFLLLSNAKKIYPSRSIISIYFENLNNDCYIDTAEGNTPRKKIRIRSYNTKKNYFLETKITSNEGRLKSTNLINNKKYKFLSRYGIMDNDYGICFPKIYTMYERSYYLINNLRITFDENIKYRLYNDKKIFFDNVNVVEIKSNISMIDKIEEYISLTETKCSKYMRGFEYLNYY